MSPDGTGWAYPWVKPTGLSILNPIRKIYYDNYDITVTSLSVAVVDSIELLVLLLVLPPSRSGTDDGSTKRWRSFVDG
jgi:hypothetical protein